MSSLDGLLLLMLISVVVECDEEDKLVDVKDFQIKKSVFKHVHRNKVPLKLSVRGTARTPSAPANVKLERLLHMKFIPISGNYFVKISHQQQEQPKKAALDSKKKTNTQLPRAARSKPPKRERVTQNVQGGDSFQRKCTRNNAAVPPVFNHTNRGYLINEPNLCREDIFLLVLVHTHPGVVFRTRRDLVRRTFGSLRRVYDRGVRVVFGMGAPWKPHDLKSVKQEASETRDMIISAHSADNLTESSKVHLAELQWISEFCSQAEYVVRVDDTTFVNIPQMVLFARNFVDMAKGEGRTFFCSPSAYRIPVRRKGSPYYVSLKDWSGRLYPHFCSREWYIVSGEVISDIVRCSLHLSYFFIDDVWITGDLRSRVSCKILPLPVGYRMGDMEEDLSFTAFSDHLLLKTWGNMIVSRAWSQSWLYIMKNIIS